MKRLADLEYEESGSGPAVLFIHGAILSDTFAPTIREEALADFCCIRYRRRGYGDSVALSATPTVAEQAEDAFRLLDELSESRVHVVAHSGGGPIAVEMAVSRPAAVRSLVLLEPALQNEEMAVAFDEMLAPLVAMYDAGERGKAVHLFMRTATNRNWRAETEARLPGAGDRAEIDAAATFHGDLPSLRIWDFDKVSARITQPSMLMVGALSESKVASATALFRAAVPDAEYVVIDGADHSLQTTNPEAVAPPIADFLRSH